MGRLTRTPPPNSVWIRRGIAYAQPTLLKPNPLGVTQMLPSEFSEFRPYPGVARFVAQQLDMQFNDVRAMMRLPMPDLQITAGCNFAAASTLCNLISGISMVLYSGRSRAGAGAKFKLLLEDFYPWRVREDKTGKAKALYDLVRNPLVHSLGVAQTPTQRASRMAISKSSLTETQLLQLEMSPTRPRWVPLALRRRRRRYVLSVPGLYWGVLALLRRLAANPQQMQTAQAAIARYGIT